MDNQEHKITTVSSGHHELCHRCGWPYPNPHPSARHRRSHKKVCGTIQGYTLLIQSHTEDPHSVVSEDHEHSSDEEDEHVPIEVVKVENTNTTTDFGKGSIVGVGGKSINDVYSDAVQEFSDSGISHVPEEPFERVKERENSKDLNTVEVETTDRTEQLNVPAPIDQSLSVDSINENSNRGIQQELVKEAEQDSDNQKEEKSISSVTLDPEEVKVLDDDLVPTKVTNNLSALTNTPETLDTATEVKCVTDSSESKHNGDVELNQEINVVVLSENSESPTLLNKKCSTESTVIDNDKLYNSENVSVGSEALQDEDEAKLTEVKDGVSATDNINRSDSLEGKTGSVSGSNGGVVGKSNKDVFSDAVQEFSDNGISPLLEQPFEHVKESENSKDHNTVEDETTEQLNDPTRIDQSPSVESTTENSDGGTQHELTKKAEQDADTRKEENLKSSITDDPEEVKVSDFTSVEGERTGDLDDILVTKLVKNVPSPLTETHENLNDTSEVKCVASSSEPEHNGGVALNQDGNVVILSEGSESSTLEKQVLNQKGSEESAVIDNDKLYNSENVSVSTKCLQDEDEAKLTEVKDGVSVTDISDDISRSDSLEVKCGSVVSDKSETNLLDPKSTTNGEGNLDKSDDFEAPSFMTLVQSSEVKADETNNKSDDVKAAWFPSITNLTNESEGRKKNEEIISKVTNWNQAKEDIPTDEAKSPKDKEFCKDEAAANNEIEKELDSPIEINKEKKNKRKASYWMPFVCCSSKHRDL